jgi:hypothetical protein
MRKLSNSADGSQRKIRAGRNLLNDRIISEFRTYKEHVGKQNLPLSPLPPAARPIPFASRRETAKGAPKLPGPHRE